MQEFYINLPNTAETFKWIIKEAAGTGWYIDEENDQQVLIAFEVESLRDRAAKEIPQL